MTTKSSTLRSLLRAIPMIGRVLVDATAIVLMAPSLARLEKPATDLRTFCIWAALRGVKSEMPMTGLTGLLLRLPNRRLRYRLVLLPLSILFVVRSSLAAVRVKGPGVRCSDGLTLTEQLFQVVHACLGNAGYLVPEDYYVYALYRPERAHFAPLSAHNMHLRGLIDLGIAATGGTADERFPSVLTDKVKFQRFCREQGFPTPDNVAWFAGKDITWLDAEAETIPPRDLFVKPVHGAVGTGTRRVFYLPERDAFRLDDDPAHRELDRSTLVDSLVEASAREPLLLQERLRNHPDLVTLVGANTLCTLRVFTAHVLPERFSLVSAHLRFTLRNAASDNFSSGGLACLVDPDSGALGAAYHKYGAERLDCHEHSGIRFSEFRLPLFAEVLELCLRAHRVLAGMDRHYRMPVVGWDVAVTPDGPRLVEANSPCDVILQKGLDQPLFANEAFVGCIESYLEEFRRRLAY